MLSVLSSVHRSLLSMLYSPLTYSKALFMADSQRHTLYGSRAKMHNGNVRRSYGI